MDYAMTYLIENTDHSLLITGISVKFIYVHLFAFSLAMPSSLFLQEHNALISYE